MAALSGTLLKRYTISGLVAEGGFGAIYRARDCLLGRDVAVKVILPQLANIPGFIRRFEAEAQIVARLEHPHIIPLYDFWRDTGGAYLVMRWMPGGSLHDTLRQGPLPVSQAGRLFEQLAGALALAHRRGVLHRDLKPANVLRDAEGNAYLADFGIAKEIEPGAHGPASELRAFTPGYAAPEQIELAPATPQTDIYSLATVFFEMLTGTRAFAGNTPSEVARRQLAGEPPALLPIRPEFPPALEAVLRRAMARDPAERYADVSTFARAVQAQLSQLGPLALAGAPADAPTLAPFATVELATPTSSSENPYKGLRAFEEADAADFFGRDTLLERLLGRLNGHDAEARFLAVVGPSGSGKSSVVKAGLLPALRRGALANAGRWFIVSMTPGARPFEELEAALLRVAINPPASMLEQLQSERGLLRAVHRVLPADQGIELLLLIDQFEELFTLASDEAQRTLFLHNLLSAVTEPRSRLRLMITLRADFYDRPLLYPGFGELIQRQTELVLPLNADELEQAISQPALRAGLQLEAGLTSAIIHDVAAQPGALPLLQYALTELYERRAAPASPGGAPRLTLAAYQASGGVQGALARRADTIYANLNQLQQASARQLFLRLVTPGEGSEDTRRRARLDEFADHSSAVLQAYGQARLLTFDRDPINHTPTVEVAHEALLRAWGRLRSWIDAAREQLRQQQRLAAAANDWAANQHDPSYLARGTRLAQFVALLPSDDGGRRTERQGRRTEDGAPRAEDGGRSAEGGDPQALNQIPSTVYRLPSTQTDPPTLVDLNPTELAFLEASQAAEAAEANRREQARRAELAQAQALAEVQRLRADEAAAAGRGLRRRALLLAGALVLALLALLAAALFGVQSQRSEAQAIQQRATAVAGAAAAQTAQAQTQAQLNVADAQRLAFAAQGLPAASRETALLLAYEAATRDVNPISARVLRELYGSTTWFAQRFAHQGAVYSASFSPDGSRIVTAAADNTAAIWDLQGNRLATLAGHSALLRYATYSPDGSRILTASEDNTARLWDANGKPLAVLAGHTGLIYRAIFSPDGRRILTASADGTARLWQADGTLISVLRGHQSDIYRAAFSPDGRRIATASKDTTARLWDADGKPLMVLTAHTDEVLGVGFAPDGRLVTASLDRSARLWDANGTPLAMLDQPGIGFGAVVNISPDGTSVLLATIGTSAVVWTFASERPYTSLSASAQVVSATYSADGNQIVLGATDGEVSVWQQSSSGWRRFGTLYGHSQRTNSVSFSRDGGRVLSASWDASARLWQPAARQLAADQAQTYDAVLFPDNEERVLALTSSPAGEQRANQVLLLDGQGKLLKGLLKGSLTSAGFSKNNRRIFGGGRDGVGRLWDADGNLLAEMRGHTSGIGVFDITSDGSRVVTCALFTSDEDRSARLWDDQGHQLALLTVADEKVLDVVFSPDGQFVATGSTDGKARVWDANGKLLATLSGHTNTISTVSFSPDGQRLVTGSYDETARLWERSGTLLATLEGHGDTVFQAQFSPDGKFIYTQASETVRLWEPTGTLRATLRHTEFVSDIAASPDGSMLATLAYQSLYLWDANGAALAQFRQPAADLTLSARVAFTTDGSQIILSAGSLRWRYPARMADLLQTVACRLPRDLTAEEQAQYSVRPPLHRAAARQCR